MLFQFLTIEAPKVDHKISVKGVMREYRDSIDIVGMLTPPHIEEVEIS